MKVKVKLEREYSSWSHNLIALKAVYKTNKSFFKKEIDIIRFHEIYVDDEEEQEPFIVQLENFINGGDIEERVCDLVARDIIRHIKEKNKKQTDEDKLDKMLKSLEKIKFTFDMDTDNI